MSFTATKTLVTQTRLGKHRGARVLCCDLLCVLPPGYLLRVVKSEVVEAGLINRPVKGARRRARATACA